MIYHCIRCNSTLKAIIGRKGVSNHETIVHIEAGESVVSRKLAIATCLEVSAPTHLVNIWLIEFGRASVCNRLFLFDTCECTD